MRPHHDYLPGLAPQESTDGAAGPLEQAARNTIAALKELDLLAPRHALVVELCYSLAQAVDAGLAAPKISVATATLSSHLLATLDKLPAPPEEAGDEFQALIDKLEGLSS